MQVGNFFPDTLAQDAECVGKSISIKMHANFGVICL
ncbi:hypothetical protein GGR07_000374 [Bacteroides pyogenes]|nr:hypothetical protein [Bacteroides pyogenes]SUV31794.1 Uncharacterised protein [Bacteroides pyogenes]